MAHYLLVKDDTCMSDIRIYNDNEVRDEVYCSEYELVALETEYDYCFEEDEYYYFSPELRLLCSVPP